MGFGEKEGLVLKIANLVQPLSPEEKREIFNDILLKEKKGMPISIFRSDMSSLAIIVKYYRDVRKKSFKGIAILLNRKKSTIYNTYYKSVSKYRGKFDISDGQIIIPLEIFSDRRYSILESLVEYMKDTLNIPYLKISILLGKKYSTIKTVYWRYNQKRERYAI